MRVRVRVRVRVLRVRVLLALSHRRALFHSHTGAHLKRFGLSDDFCTPEGDLGWDVTEKTEDLAPVVSKSNIDADNAQAEVEAKETLEERAEAAGKK